MVGCSTHDDKRAGSGVVLQQRTAYTTAVDFQIVVIRGDIPMGSVQDKSFGDEQSTQSSCVSHSGWVGHGFLEGKGGEEEIPGPVQ
jgi:hypothetical protein